LSEISGIEWTDATWNPVTGCTKVSQGCKHCYALRWAERWRGTPGHPYEQGFDLKLWHNRLELPLTWREPKRVFVNSMSDLFHERVPDEFIEQVFETMRRASWHTFQILTKRARRLGGLAPSLRWPANVWIGVSLEDENVLWRIDELRKVIEARVRFLSCEPLIGPLDHLDLRGVNWVIVGGESGPGAREMKPAWVRSIRRQCREASVPFFFKQWGGIQKSRTGRVLDGRTWDQFPRGATSSLEKN